MQLIDLLDGERTDVMEGSSYNDAGITGLTCDSRKVAPGFLFAAIPGTGDDGRRYIDEALARGAAAVLSMPPVDENIKVPVVLDNSPRHRYAMMAARFFAKQPDTICAVTGTNGKTSVVSFARQMWTVLGHPAASLGTLGLSAHGPDRDIEHDFGLTTPDPADLHESLAELSNAGIDKLAMEASSQGLSQHRLDGVRVSMAVFTNLTPEHLDYHGGMDGYLAAKRRLFEEILKDDGTAILNADDETFAALQATANARGLRVISYGHKGVDVRLDDIFPTPDGQRLGLTVDEKSYEVDLNLPGAFQADNAMCALALMLADGADVERAVQALESLEGVAGRMQRVARLGNGAAVYLDYAHTPDALKNILLALGPHVERRLIVVFGCGGERDVGKRPEMGRIASEMADIIYVTDDNPRSEDAAAIRRQILDRCDGAVEIADRRDAISAAVAELQPGDVLVVAGKGHETGQIVGDTVHPFNDAEEILSAISEAEA
ncbi:MAG: UDP-N-acetylmuramoyl-L-alanyl-D-glutamate--2,6-diaminopimelate ligase [Rhodospirillaceae bacterium]|nr:UDP-N-acetylmuramoyl-L-alanyl-D-glutamate--2,6-diaminopimelate ligase [Rhodospirillaceae bacterium]MBT4219630.1 UDP-N-acetylmuramoyl-L-alanyl-D-glutamate--2,6-diaminopimelate ligase [Rhodospirillaceae bacterium]MBT4463045.1 UDP-N-acetylmuramoyl-L-alanyl-D-glutamate--2,6-diaminopimelate ligase [Rhodospirillaceae bacterium]MBT6406301.1 UDP-N-acetylmuramoyl-L-alanyl-D-glutamate--2,6-diaminopimelate ligase [Rhodospirillaceae bacterium]MBT7355892.1 UDP-N-acetylmuramoyl-L-alanyl-D-glutamate--2,6-d